MFPRTFIIAHFFDLSRLLHKKAECGEGSDSISGQKRERAPVWGCAFSLEQMTGIRTEMCGKRRAKRQVVRPHILFRQMAERVLIQYPVTKEAVHPKRGCTASLEQMTGIEPAYSAWEADTLPLSYICNRYSLIIHQNFRSVKRKQDIFLKMPCFFVSCSVYEIKIGAAPPIIDPSKVPIMTA